jgi:FkbM family methyltransferase
MDSVSIGKSTILYNDPHDIGAILEVFVMDVYRIRNLWRGDTVLDLGAGIGEFAISCSRTVGNSGLVISVEPNPQDFEALRKNISLNKCENVKVFNNAFSSSSEMLNLDFKGHSFVSRTISSKEIQRCLEENGRNRIDAIKIDIEGAEIDAISELKNFVANVRSIMIELHGTKEKVDRLLEPIGFRFRRLTRRRYIISTLFFALRHPVSAIKLWKMFNYTSENPGVMKIFSGIEITEGEKLMVGVYEKE